MTVVKEPVTPVTSISPRRTEAPRVNVAPKLN
jgi:hypothetical protein